MQRRMRSIGAVLVLIAAIQANAQTLPGESRGDQSRGADKSPSSRLVTGVGDHLQRVVDGTVAGTLSFFQLKPVAAQGDVTYGPGVSFVDMAVDPFDLTFMLDGGTNERLFFELQAGGWGGHMTTCQADIDWVNGYASGTGADLLRPIVACDPTDATLGEEACRLALGRGSKCDGVNPNTCRDVFVNSAPPPPEGPPGVPDPRLTVQGINGVAVAKMIIGSVPIGNPGGLDVGQVGYNGVLAVDVPASAAGTYTIGFVIGSATFMTVDGADIVIDELRPLVIKVGVGRCCVPSTGECIADATRISCDTLGGIFAEGSECIAGACCEYADDTAPDCDGNGILDVCEVADRDCNGNSQIDTCDITIGVSDDCNANSIPDECEVDEDCNTNGTQDICDIADGSSGDCNFDLVPDDCQPDEDCDTNGTRDICDIGAGASDCNGNLSPDTCDLANGTSVDINGDGVPDECCNPSAPIFVEATNRYLGFKAPASWAGQQLALRVTTISQAGFGPPDGLPRWVGIADTFFADARRNPAETFLAAPIMCEPVYRQWSTEETTYVYGSEIVPSSRDELSTYEIQAIPVACDAGFESNFSPPVSMTTPRFGDTFVVPGCTSLCTEYKDVSAVVAGFLADAWFSAFLRVPPKFEVQLGLNRPDPSQPVSMNDVRLVAQAFVGPEFADVFAGPETCPHRVPACGDGVLDPGEQCDDGNVSPGDGCNAGCRAENATASYRLVPVTPPEATGLSYAADVVISGNDIFVPAGARRVWFKLEITGWGGEMTVWQATVDWVSGYASGTGADLQRPIVPCDGTVLDRGEETCMPALGRGSLCILSASPNICGDAFTNSDSSSPSGPPGSPDPDLVAPGFSLASQPRMSLGSSTFGGSGTLDVGQIGYGGAFAVDVPADAAGTYTIGFDDSDYVTFMKVDDIRIAIAELRPATLTIASGCCFETTCSALGPQACLDALGTPVDACGGDCNFNGRKDRCEIVAGIVNDCNGNNIPDECEPDCNGDGFPDECDITDGISGDCNGNGVPDDCELTDMTSQDCNGNAQPDECDVTDGTSGDCNTNGIPDECEPNGDCNGNGIQDICDIAGGTSGDCNFDLVPDECQPDADCNANGVRDLCDIGSGVANDCNGNLSPDSCDIASGTSLDANGDGVPDECCMPSAPIFLEPAKSRYLSLSGIGTPGVRSAIRITFGPNAVFPAIEGQSLWVGPPREYPEEDSSNADRNFVGAGLSCEPHFRDWSTIDVLQVFGAEIVPRSRSQQSLYTFQLINESCPDSFEVNFSDPLQVPTGVFADMAPPFFPSTRISFRDIATAVTKFLGDPVAAIKAVTQLQPNVVRPAVAISFKDINATVQSFLGLPYLTIVPGAQPCTCPSLVTCGVTACTGDAQCAGGVCIDGFCTDACGRCSP